MTNKPPFNPMQQSRTAAQSSGKTTVDQGLRSYMLSIYNYMTLGLALTGAVAYLTASSPSLLNAIFSGPQRWLVLLAPLGFVWFLSARIGKIKASTAQTLFWIYAAINGLALSSIFVAYTGESIARVFFISASMFGVMSLYGYTTRKDLSGMGSFLFMGLIGVIIASVVNMFLASPALYFAISVIGVLVFVGLTAYDTQKLKHLYYAADSGETKTKKAVLGALTLYLYFLNMFLFLLQLLGNRR